MHVFCCGLVCFYNIKYIFFLVNILVIFMVMHFCKLDIFSFTHAILQRHYFDECKTTNNNKVARYFIIRLNDVCLFKRVSICALHKKNSHITLRQFVYLYAQNNILICNTTNLTFSLKQIFCCNVLFIQRLFILAIQFS